MGKLAVKEFGKGQPLIILHGLFGSSDNWLTIGKRLADHFHLFIPDQRNHGDSFHSDEFTYRAMAADLREFMEEKAIKNPVIIGHSMGGKTAMTFALSHPDMYQKMIVVDISPKAYDVRHDHILEGLNAIQLSRATSRQDADQQLKSYVPSLAVRQFLLKNLKRKDHGYEWKLNLPVITDQIENVGEAINSDQTRNKEESKPVLFIKGKNSDYILPEDRIAIEKLFPRSQIVEIENAGHWVHAEQPEAFLGALREFIDQ